MNLISVLNFLRRRYSMNKNIKRNVFCKFCEKHFATDVINELEPILCPFCNKKFFFINNTSIDIDDYNVFKNKTQKTTNTVVLSIISLAVFVCLFIIGFYICFVTINNKTEAYYSKLDKINEDILILQKNQKNIEYKISEEIEEAKTFLKRDFEHSLSKISVSQLHTDVMEKTYVSVENQFKRIESKLKEDFKNFTNDIQNCMFTDFIRESDPNTDYLFVDPELLKKAREKLNKATQIPPVVLAPVSNKVLTEKDLIGTWEIFSDGYMFTLTLNEDHTFSYADKNTPWITDGWEIKKDVLLIYWKHNKIKDYSMSEAVDLRTGIYATPNKSRQLQFNEKGEVTKDRQWRRISVMSKIK